MSDSGLRWIGVRGRSSPCLKMPGSRLPPTCGPALLGFALAALSGVALASQPAAVPTETAPARPNVIWICLDAARADNMSCYGYERPTTPNLARFASRGVLFQQHFSQAMMTTLSVPSYLSSRYFPVLGHEPFGRAIEREPALGEYLIPEIMAKNGYETALISAHPWFSPRSRVYRSFQEQVLLKPENPGGKCYADLERLNEAVLSWVKTKAARPFFLYLHAMDTHFPHPLAPPYDCWKIPGYKSEQVGEMRPFKTSGCRFSERDKEQLRGMYDGSILYADHHLGRLFESLDESGLLARTIVIINADHGELLGEDGVSWGHPARTYDWLTHVPLIMAGPGIPQRIRVSALTENVDIVPTLIDLLDLETDARTDGVSLKPLLETPTGPEVHRFLFAKMGGYDWPTHYVVRDRRYKFEIDTKTNREHLYAIPDTDLPRYDLLDDLPDVAAPMREYVYSNLVPLREAYDGLPTRAFYFALSQHMHNIARPADAYIVEGTGITDKSRHDNKWSYSTAYDYLWASYEEDAPPLTLRLAVPNGHYLVQMELLSHNDFWGTKAASAFRVRANGDSHFQYIKEASRPRSDWGYVFVDVGEYDVEDAALELVLDEGDDEHWAIVRRIRLIPRESVSEQERREMEEQLRGLGYLGD